MPAPAEGAEAAAVDANLTDTASSLSGADAVPPSSAASTAVPVESRPARGRITVPSSSTTAKRGGAAQAPFYPVLVPLPGTVPAIKPAPATANGSGPQERPSMPSKADNAAAPERTSVNDSALEVRIKAKQEDNDTPPPPSTVAPATAAAIGTASVVSTLADTKPVGAAPVPAVSSTTPPPIVAAQPAANLQETAPAATSQTPAASPARGAEMEEPIVPQATQQPLRSVSLEFTPDGAGDVRLRLSERSGEVHISLHSSDASLSSRLHEGVHDLVGSLSSAGYDAEAWTPGQGHQNNQREPEQRRSRRADPDGSGESFGEVFQQPIQEIS